MHTLSSVIEPEGPLVDVLIGLAAGDVRTLRLAGRPVPAPVAVRALIDTGSEGCCADPKVLAPFLAQGMTLLRFVFTNVPALGGISLGAEYAVDLTIVHPSGAPRANLVLRDHSALEQPLGALGYQALIGRDALARCLFVYDGPGERFTLAY
jgi:hypothetical protein